MILELLQNLLILFLFALIIVFLLSKLKISPIIGFLLTGVIVGPSGLGLIKNYHLISTLAELGIIFLLFVIGIEFSIKKLIAYRKELLVAGLLQVSLTIFIIFIFSYFLFKTSIKLSLFLGFLLTMSSTALVLKILMDRGELNTPFGRLAFGILIFQDICAVIIISVIPILGGQIESYNAIILNLGKSFFILGCIFLGTFYIFPFIFYQIVKTRNRELFLITILVLSLGTAFFLIN